MAKTLVRTFRPIFRKQTFGRPVAKGALIEQCVEDIENQIVGPNSLGDEVHGETIPRKKRKLPQLTAFMRIKFVRIRITGEVEQEEVYNEKVRTFQIHLAIPVYAERQAGLMAFARHSHQSHSI